MDGHKMVKSSVNGRDHWSCDKCGYGTFRKESAEQHSLQPY